MVNKTIQEIYLSSSFRLPASLNQQMNEKIIADGYGMRGKSKWVKEAVERLLALSDYQELVSLSSETQQTCQPATIRIPRSLMLSIESAIISIRKKHPELEGLKSKVIRTAIMQRLIRE